MPNPARGPLSIEYALPQAARVELAIVDVRGRIVNTLVRGDEPAGRHTARWSAAGVAPGLYLARFTAPGFEAVERFVVVR